jgi:hypothetical protein
VLQTVTSNYTSLVFRAPHAPFVYETKEKEIGRSGSTNSDVFRRCEPELPSQSNLMGGSWCRTWGTEQLIFSKNNGSWGTSKQETKRSSFRWICLATCSSSFLSKRTNRILSQVFRPMASVCAALSSTPRSTSGNSAVKAAGNAILRTRRRSARPRPPRATPAASSPGWARTPASPSTLRGGATRCSTRRRSPRPPRARAPCRRRGRTATAP